MIKTNKIIICFDANTGEDDPPTFGTNQRGGGGGEGVRGGW